MTELILVPMATVETPKAKTMHFWPIFFTSSSDMDGLSGYPTTKISVRTKQASPQMKKLTKLLVSFMIQSTAYKEKVEALPNLLIPI